MTAVRAGVPMELEFIVGKCLAKEAADRYQHASEIAVDLRTLAEKLKSGRSTILRTSQMTGAEPAGADGDQGADPVMALPTPSARVWQVLTAVLGLIAIALRIRLLPSAIAGARVPAGPAILVYPSGSRLGEHLARWPSYRVFRSRRERSLQHLAPLTGK